jgi:glycosyltransferase involved in cell wall biosynthesis
MKIIYIIPGSGGSFYCQNCMRDNELVHSLQDLGHHVVVVPMYLPLTLNKDELGQSPVFYGAINIYLKQQFPAFRKAPLWLERLFDAKPMLKMAARFSGSTNAKGLEEMTISMLLGEEGEQASELEHLIQWLKHEEKPDVIHLSNALLLGLAPRLKEELQVRLFCSLQDEHQWIDPMDAPFAKRVWNLLSEKAKQVDGFIAVSGFYAEYMQKKMQVAPERIQVVPIGIDLRGYEPAPLDMQPPVIGYLNRLAEPFGLDTLLEAFILLKKKFIDLRLHITGGHTAEDKPFIKRLQHRMHKAGVQNSVKIFPEFDRPQRLEFMRALSVFSAPVAGNEAFGAYLIEALAGGVPVVQPECGAFPEFIRATGGGLLCAPNDPAALAEKIGELLSQPDRARTMGQNGREAVLRLYSIQVMAHNMITAYNKIQA